MIELDLGPARYWQPFPWSTTKVRISDDARKCVVFLGDCDPSGDPAQFEPFATGFLMHAPSQTVPTVYLVTTKHCVQEGNPFWVRQNTESGSELRLIEEPEWVFHEDETVDVAVLEFPPFPGERRASFRFAWWGRSISKKWSEHKFGPGDLTYTVGLFSYHRGASRNIPLVHSGNIAAFYEDEKIRVRNLNQTGEEFVYIDAYVVQCAAMPGASGSPVFVRETKPGASEKHVHEYRTAPSNIRPTRSEMTTGAPRDRWPDPPTAYGELYLLGVWRSSWEVDNIKSGSVTIRNPAGYGIVVPAEKITEVLNMPVLKNRRDKIEAEQKAAENKTLPVDDSLPRKDAQKRFDDTLKKMLDTPPDPRRVTRK